MLKIYKATFTSPGTMNVSFVRNKAKDEVFLDGGFCKRIFHGIEYYYRINDDPGRDAVRAHDVKTDLHGLHFGAIYRKQLIYIAEADQFEPSAQKIGKNVIVIESLSQSVYAHNSLPFVYIFHDNYIWPLNTETMEILPCNTICCDWHSKVFGIIKVCNSTVILAINNDQKNYIAEQKLPDEYIVKSKSSGKECATGEYVTREREIDADLRITARKVLGTYTYLFQVECGTIFYLNFVFPKRLYVNWKGDEIDVGVPSEFLYYDSDARFIGAFGNALYFSALDEKDETFYNGGLCSRVRNGVMYLYRLCDDPDVGGVTVDLPHHIRKELTFAGIHRGKVVYFREAKHTWPSVHTVGANGIVIEMPSNYGYSALYIHNSYLWFFYKYYIFQVDSDSLKIILTLRTPHEGDMTIASIAGIKEGEVTLQASIRLTDQKIWRFLITAQIPEIPEGLPSAAEDSRENFSKNWKRIQNEEGNKDVLDVASQEFQSRFLKEFKINKVIGVGGCGIIFNARSISDDANDGIVYAVKRIAIRASGKPYEIKAEEAFSLLKLEHPGIVKFYTCWTEKPPPGWQQETDMEMLKMVDSMDILNELKYPQDCEFLYIKMELCDRSLAEWLEKNRTITSRKVPRMVEWFKQIVSAVAYMHEKNLIHRDLKPGNVLISGDFWDKRLKLCDVGISAERRADFYNIDTTTDRAAKFVNAGMPTGGTTLDSKMKELRVDGMATGASRTQIGTKLYMSPEQQSCFANYSSKTDVFALGLILIELCVVLTTEERAKVFDDCRRGDQEHEIIEDLKTAKFVKWLTLTDPADRPTCKQILDHPYITLNDYVFLPQTEPTEQNDSE